MMRSTLALKALTGEPCGGQVDITLLLQQSVSGPGDEVLDEDDDQASRDAAAKEDASYNASLRHTNAQVCDIAWQLLESCPARSSISTHCGSCHVPCTLCICQPEIWILNMFHAMYMLSASAYAHAFPWGCV
jgi:hypothetical protein